MSNEWWEIEHILENAFNTMLDLSLLMQNLSGGELTKLFFAIGLARSPNLLLLDEPTNHLDYLALEELRQFLCQFQCGFMIVSHKLYAIIPPEAPDLAANHLSSQRASSVSK